MIDQYRSAAGVLLAMHMFDLYCGHKNYHFQRNANGKPIIKSDTPFAFNLSHSGQWIAGVASIERMIIGIDIEEIKPVPGWLMKDSNIFTHDERRWLFESECPTERFYTLWTAKESCLKAMGTGLVDELHKITIDNTRKFIRNKLENTIYHFIPYDEIPQYKLTVSAHQPISPSPVTYVSQSDLFDVPS
ncbi:4'-phosphopantetheinyl transferase superfamily protein [Salicibibacter cibarius]|uniref:4'-phosphopantetheinyl transferase superfamily protein n=1 Tax=Salicibibacter cibarius TaxID=2743000 RepID=A0A7T6Z6Q7_9BACI|nr:4'-phosphopantetheinyl transferase superfamily protein [Salicibibacter cibarius]